MGKKEDAHSIPFENRVLCTVDDIEKYLGIAKTRVWDMLNSDSKDYDQLFPKPIPIGERIRKFYVKELLRWVGHKARSEKIIESHGADGSSIPETDSSHFGAVAYKGINSERLCARPKSLKDVSQIPSLLAQMQSNGLHRGEKSQREVDGGLEVVKKQFAQKHLPSESVLSSVDYDALIDAAVAGDDYSLLVEIVRTTRQIDAVVDAALRSQDPICIWWTATAISRASGTEKQTVYTRVAIRDKAARGDFGLALREKIMGLKHE